MELMDHFLSAWGGDDQSKEEVDLEVLKHIVDSVGSVQVENGVKFVCLNTSGNVESAMRSGADGHDHAECNGNIQETLDNNCINGNPDDGAQTGEGDVPDSVQYNPSFAFTNIDNSQLDCISLFVCCICY